MAPPHNKRVLFNERPTAEITSSTFRIETVLFDLKPGSGEVLVKVFYVSLDAAMRVWMWPVKTYIDPLEIGQVMRAGGIGVVTQAGKESKLKVGDFVYGEVGWQEYGVFKDEAMTKLEVPPGAQLIDFLGALGLNALTAYFGLTDVGKLKAGETLVVSGAAGGTGSAACQIGKALGARVIAIAGSGGKCQWLEKEMGVDKAFNYKRKNFKQEFAEGVDGVDVFYDNVGGEILDLVLSKLKMHARVVKCGSVSAYNGPQSEIQNYVYLVPQRAQIRGFIIFDYIPQYAEGLNNLGKWFAEGKLQSKFHVADGLEKAPESLPMLYNGGNTGKLIVKVADPNTVQSGLALPMKS